MKVGIITLPLHINFGGILQAYALQTVLTKMGHEVTILDKSKFWKINLVKYPLALLKRSVYKFILRKRHVEIFFEKNHNESYRLISQHTRSFIDKYLHDVEVDDLNLLPNGCFDVLIAGSDQVWRPMYFCIKFGTIKHAFLDFAEKWNNVKRISYAASFGTEQWEYSPEEETSCKELISKFNLVTVREDSGVELCKKYFKVEAKHVLDPTMLLEKGDYEYLVRNTNFSKSNGSLLTYILDTNDEINSLIAEVAIQKNMKTFNVGRNEDINAPIEERIQKPIERWLRGFMDAEFVLTDSFHACAFSIIFNKPFAVLGNKQRGQSRFISLLKMFNLEDRLVSTAGEINQLGTIDWKRVNAKREEMKAYSISLLVDSLK